MVLPFLLYVANLVFGYRILSSKASFTLLMAGAIFFPLLLMYNKDYIERSQGNEEWKKLRLLSIVILSVVVFITFIIIVAV